MKIAMRQAVKHFQSNGLETNEASVGSLQKLIEAGLAQFFQMQDIPMIIQDGSATQKPDSIFLEMVKSVFGKSKYSFAGLFFCFLYATNGLIPKRNIPKYLKAGELVRQHLLVSSKKGTTQKNRTQRAMTHIYKLIVYSQRNIYRFFIHFFFYVRHL